MKNQYHKGEGLYPDLIWASQNGDLATFTAFGQFWVTQADDLGIYFHRLGPADEFPTTEVTIELEL